MSKITYTQICITDDGDYVVRDLTGKLLVLVEKTVNSSHTVEGIKLQSMFPETTKPNYIKA